MADSFLVHSFHAAAVPAASWSSLLLFRDLRHQRFGGQHQGRDRTGVLQCRAHHFGRIDHARLDQIFVLAGQGVVAEVVVLGIVHFAQNNCAFFARVLGDLTQRLDPGALHDVQTDVLIPLELQPIESGNTTAQGYSAAGNNAFFHGRAGRVHSVFDTSFLLFHFRLGRSAYLDHSHATDQLRQPLLQFLAVVVAGGLVDLAANFLYPAFDLGVLALAFDDRGVVLVHRDLFGLAEVGHLDVLQLDAQVFGDGLAAGEGGNVLQHSFAAIAKAGSLCGRDLQRAPQFVDHERSQGLAFDVFGHDQQRLAALGDLLQQRQQVFHRADFLFVDQNVGVLERNFHALGIGHEVGREVAAVELHAFNHVQLGLEGLGLLDGDDPILADLLHGLGNDVADGLVIVGGNGAHLGNHVAGDGLGELVQLAFDAVAFLVEIATNRGDRLLDTALHGHGVGAGRDRLHALAIDRLGQNGGGGGAVAGYIGGLAGDFTNHLCAHVFERVLEFD